MRYELKHDKLAAQIFLRASAAAKARRRAEEVYAFYGEIAAKRLLTAEELDYLSPFATVLQIPEELKQAMDKGREKIREAKEAEMNKIKEQEAKEKKLREEAETALAKVEQNLAVIRERNLVTFREFAELGTRLVYTLDHAEALQKLGIAAAVEVDDGAKREALTAPLSELIFFFAESGRRPELACEAAGLLLGLGQAEPVALLLGQCVRENWSSRTQFAPLLAALPEAVLLKSRYYPVMANVPLGKDGVFQMGSDPSEWGHRSDEQLHEVKLSLYQIGVYPVTFYQFALFSEATGRGLASRTPYWGRFGDHPLVNVSWYEAAEYANWLNEQQGIPPWYEIHKVRGSDPDNASEYDYLKWKVERKPGAWGFRLPTEAEWELAARGGAGTPRHHFAGGDVLGEVGWYWENSGDEPLSGDWDLNRIYDNNGRTHPVGQKQANEIGLYDMSGNVFEWCWDWYGEYTSGPQTNPFGPDSGSDRVCRGGSWYGSADYCRVALRIIIHPGNRGNDLGFRLAFVPQSGG